MAEVTSEDAPIERVDKYMIRLDGVLIRATPDQEQRISDLSIEERQRFARIMGGTAR